MLDGTSHAVVEATVAIPHETGVWVALFTFIYMQQRYEVPIIVGAVKDLTARDADAIIAAHTWRDTARAQFLSYVEIKEVH